MLMRIRLESERFFFFSSKIVGAYEYYVSIEYIHLLTFNDTSISIGLHIVGTKWIVFVFLVIFVLV